MQVFCSENGVTIGTFTSLNPSQPVFTVPGPANGLNWYKAVSYSHVLNNW